MGFLPGKWEVCAGMTKDGKCRARAGRHTQHRKSFGKAYGRTDIPTDQGKQPGAYVLKHGFSKRRKR
jgi:hypothetical protein